MPQKATLYQFGEEISFEAGKQGVKNVFPDDKLGQTLIVVYDDYVVKYSGIAFVHSNPRKTKDEE